MNNTEKEKINQITDGELDLIEKFARKKLNKDELYTFSLILCDNEIDRDNEKFTVSALYELAKLFVGKMDNTEIPQRIAKAAGYK